MTGLVWIESRSEMTGEKPLTSGMRMESAGVWTVIVRAFFCPEDHQSVIISIWTRTAYVEREMNGHTRRGYPGRRRQHRVERKHRRERQTRT
jgi:hypothetical protein